jgi:hypothetical protein
MLPLTQYTGTPLLTAGTMVTTRLPVNAVLYASAPPRTGRRGRSRLNDHRPGTSAETGTISRHASRHQAKIRRQGT